MSASSPAARYPLRALISIAVASALYRTDALTSGATDSYVVPKYVLGRFGSMAWNGTSANSFGIACDTESQVEPELLEDELDWDFYAEELRPRDVQMLNAQFFPAGRYKPRFFDDPLD